MPRLHLASRGHWPIRAKVWSRRACVDGDAGPDPSNAEALVNEVIGPLPPAFSDDALALAFSERHDGQLLHVSVWGSWLRWDGSRWGRTSAVPPAGRRD